MCASLDADEMREVSKTMAHLPVKDGDALLEEGASAKFLYVVVSGTFRLLRVMSDGRRQIIGFAFPGDLLGMSAGKEYSFSAEAVEPSLICRFSLSYLQELSVRHPDIKDRLIVSGQIELAKARDHIMLLGTGTAEERVIAFLEMVAARTGRQHTIEAFYLPMSRQDIADYLGLRMETLSRTLTSLRKQGRLAEVSGRVVRFAENCSAMA